MPGSIANGLLKLTSKPENYPRLGHCISSSSILFHTKSLTTFFYSLFEFELNFVDRLIAMDVRNNSAWNQRYFVLNHTGFAAEVIERELKYVMNRIQLVKNNESTWNFLRGLLEHGTGKLDQHPEVQNGYLCLYRVKYSSFV